MQIIFQGNAKSTSTIYKFFKNNMYLSPKGRELKDGYIWEAKSQYKGKVLTEDLKVEIDFYFGDRKRRDIDNYNKLVLDALNGVVWEDDVQIQELTLRKFYDKEHPRIELRISV